MAQEELVFDGVKVFSATKFRDREVLGEKVTDWLGWALDDKEIVDKVVTQSSDSEFHCLSITLFYKSKPQKRGPRRKRWEET